MRPRPKLTIRGLMIGVAVFALATWAGIYAATPVRPKFWYHVAVWLNDRPVQPPLGNSWGAANQMESHVQRAISDELLRAAAPELDPNWIRRKVLVDDESTRNCLWYHIETDSPQERDLIARMASAYVQAYPAKIRYPVNSLTPLVYPNAIPVAKAAAALATIAVFLGVASLLAFKRAVSARAGSSSPC